MLLADTSRIRARWLSGVAAGLSLAVALAAYFGLGDRDWSLIVPVLACAAAVVWPIRTVVATAMLVTAEIIILERDGSGVLFGASVVALMLALNHLQSAATQIGRRRPARQPSR